VIIGEPSIPHFGATTAEASAPMSRGLPAAGDRRHDRLPQCVALRRLGHVAFVAGKDLLVIDLLEHERGLGFGRPDDRRSAASAALGRIERQQAEQGVDGFRRHVTDERHPQQVAIVQQRCSLGDAALRGIGGRAFHHQRFRRDANGEDGAERRLANRV
jgi:hypothetical protein